MNTLTLDSLEETVALMQGTPKLPSAVKVHPSMHRLMVKQYLRSTANPPHPARVPQTIYGLRIWLDATLRPDEAVYGDIVRGEFVTAKHQPKSVTK